MNAYSHEVKTWSNKLSVGEFELEEFELVLGNSNEADEISLEYNEERDDGSGERNSRREKIIVKPISFSSTDHDALSDENIGDMREMNQDASRMDDMSISQSNMTSNVSSMELNPFYERETEDASRMDDMPISLSDMTTNDTTMEINSFYKRETEDDASRMDVDDMSISQSDMTSSTNVTTMEINSFYKRETGDDDWTSPSAASPLLWHIIVSSSESSICSTIITNMVSNDPEKKNRSSAGDEKSLHVFNNVRDYNSFSQGNKFDQNITDTSEEQKSIDRYDELYRIGKEKIRSDLQRYYIETRKIKIATNHVSPVVSKQRTKKTVRLILPTSARIEQLYIFGKEKVRSERDRYFHQHKIQRPIVSSAKIIQETISSIQDTSVLVKKQKCKERIDELYVFGRDRIRADLKRFLEKKKELT